MVDPLLVLHLFIHHSLGLNPSFLGVGRAAGDLIVLRSVWAARALIVLRSVRALIDDSFPDGGWPGGAHRLAASPWCLGSAGQAGQPGVDREKVIEDHRADTDVGDGPGSGQIVEVADSQAGIGRQLVDAHIASCRGGGSFGSHIYPCRLAGSHARNLAGDLCGSPWALGTTKPAAGAELALALRSPWAGTTAKLAAPASRPHHRPGRGPQTCNGPILPLRWRQVTLGGARWRAPTSTNRCFPAPSWAPTTGEEDRARIARDADLGPKMLGGRGRQMASDLAFS